MNNPSSTAVPIVRRWRIDIADRADLVFSLRDYFRRLGLSAEVEGPTVVELTTDRRPSEIEQDVSEWSRINETPLHLEEVREEPRLLVPPPEGFGPPRLGQLLVGKGYITEEQLAVALTESRVTDDLLGVVLLREGLIFEDELARTLSEQLAIPYISIMRVGVDESIARLLPAEVGAAAAAIPVREKGESGAGGIRRPNGSAGAGRSRPLSAEDHRSSRRAVRHQACLARRHGGTGRLASVLELLPPEPQSERAFGVVIRQAGSAVVVLGLSMHGRSRMGILRHRLTRSRFRLVVLAAAVAAASAVVASQSRAAADHAAAGTGYSVRNLVSDGFVPAEHTDLNLVNGWGITAGPSTPWWVANNGTDTSTLYDGNGIARSLVVQVEGGPTGAVFNGGSEFVVTDRAGHSGPALFMFASENGTIHGWNPAVSPPPPSTHAFVVVSRMAEGAIFKGLAIAGDRLYATDFHNGRVDVFNGSFTQINSPGAFVDPALPAGFAPFGIQNLGGRIFVTYAKQDADRQDEIAGHGLGYVDAYDTAGHLLGRVASGGDLDAPWGLAWAPAGFGQFSGDLLVGNFGDGHSRLRRSTGRPLHARRPAARQLRAADQHRWALGARVRQRHRFRTDDGPLLRRRTRRRGTRLVRAYRPGPVRPCDLDRD